MAFHYLQRFGGAIELELCCYLQQRTRSSICCRKCEASLTVESSAQTRRKKIKQFQYPRLSEQSKVFGFLNLLSDPPCSTLFGCEPCNWLLGGEVAGTPAAYEYLKSLLLVLVLILNGLRVGRDRLSCMTRGKAASC